MPGGRKAPKLCPACGSRYPVDALFCPIDGTPLTTQANASGQQQIDELHRQYRIADVLPLTPMQQGLLFHASTAQGNDDVYAVQLDITIAGDLDRERLREAVQCATPR